VTHLGHPCTQPYHRRRGGYGRIAILECTGPATIFNNMLKNEKCEGRIFAILAHNPTFGVGVVRADRNTRLYGACLHFLILCSRTSSARDAFRKSLLSNPNLYLSAGYPGCFAHFLILEQTATFNVLISSPGKLPLDGL